jgi:hypothetical protein
MNSMFFVAAYVAAGGNFRWTHGESDPDLLHAMEA